MKSGRQGRSMCTVPSFCACTLLFVASRFNQDVTPNTTFGYLRCFESNRRLTSLGSPYKKLYGSILQSHHRSLNFEVALQPFPIVLYLAVHSDLPGTVGQSLFSPSRFCISESALPDGLDLDLTSYPQNSHHPRELSDSSKKKPITVLLTYP